MAYILAKALEVVGMLTLGVALFVYGFGAEDMMAELTWLIIGSLVFLAGYVLEHRKGSRS